MKTNEAGFTLIEMLIVAAMLAILAAVAVPSYQTYIMESRRSVGQQCTIEAAAYLESFYTINRRYGTVADLAGDARTQNVVCDDDSYNINIAVPEDGQTYTITVSVDPDGVQTNDDDCNQYMLDSVGVRSAQSVPIDGARIDTTDICW